VEVRIVEHLYRWFQWEITGSNLEYTKTDARTSSFAEDSAGWSGDRQLHSALHMVKELILFAVTAA